MPIRMTDDDPGDDNDDRPSNSGGGGSGGGGNGGGGAGLIELLFFLFRHPVLALILLVIGGGFYLFGSKGPKPSAPGGHPVTASADQHGTGATLDQKVYDQALVHEPLSQAPGSLPARVSLLPFAPPRGNQGRQGSCVGWATSYAARSILLAHQTGQDPETAIFSPSFTYNQIAKAGCNGTYLKNALELLERTGDLPLSEFSYTDRSCDMKPTSEQKQRAAAFRIVGYTRLSADAKDYRTNALALKQHLAQGAPVVIGMQVGGTFQTEMEGTKVWHPTQADYNKEGEWGGHAMAIIGYDDTLEGGAFQLMNSWGRKWGEDGVAFVRYKDFDHFVEEAYGLYPMANAQAKNSPQQIRFGLVETKTQHRIALSPVSGITFRSSKPIKKGTRFKVEFSNTRPCYTYLFGQETDGSSYVLFPYTEQHSARGSSRASRA
jgi:C1A family cysteine protease